MFELTNPSWSTGIDSLLGSTTSPTNVFFSSSPISTCFLFVGRVSEGLLPVRNYVKGVTFETIFLGLVFTSLAESKELDMPTLYKLICFCTLAATPTLVQ